MGQVPVRLPPLRVFNLQMSPITPCRARSAKCLVSLSKVRQCPESRSLSTLSRRSADTGVQSDLYRPRGDNVELRLFGRHIRVELSNELALLPLPSSWQAKEEEEGERAPTEKSETK